MLLLDDESSILELYLRILLPDEEVPLHEASAPHGVVGASGPFAGHRFLAARTGEEAVAAVRREAEEGRTVGGGFFDLKLAGGMDGVAAMQAARDVQAGLLCTVVTGHHDFPIDEIHGVFLPGGADEWDYLAKPFTRWEIVQKCRQMIESSDRRRRESAHVAEICRLNRELEMWGEALEERVTERTAELAAANRRLERRNDQLSEVLEELSRTQAQLVQHERLAAIVQLGADVALQVGGPVERAHEEVGQLAIELSRLVAWDDDLARALEPRPEADRAVAELRAELRAARGQRQVDGTFALALRRIADCGTHTLRLQRIVESLRMLAGSGPRSRQVHDVNEGLTRSFEALGQPPDVELALGAVAPVLAGTEELQQAWASLLSNALTAARTRDEPRVRVTSCVERDDVVVQIEDNGPGMEPGVTARAFEPFFTTRSDEGAVGLGLTLAHVIVQRHGGSIEASSVAGEGTAVRVRLPAAWRKVGGPVETPWRSTPAAG